MYSVAYYTVKHFYPNYKLYQMVYKPEKIKTVF